MNAILKSAFLHGTNCLLFALLVVCSANHEGLAKDQAKGLAEKDEQKSHGLFRPQPDRIPDTKHLSQDEASRELGQYYMRQKKYAQAIKEFSRTPSADNFYQEIYTKRGQCFEQLGDYKSALKDYTKYLELFPNEIIGYTLRAGLHRKMGRQDLAKKDIETRDAIFSGGPKYRNPISYYDGQIKRSPNDRTLYVSRGVRLKETHKYREAIADLTKALSINPEDSRRGNVNLDQIYYERANCYENIGDYPHAIADYSAILKMDADAEEAFLYRGNCNAKIGQWDKAVRDYTECIKANVEPSPMPFIARAKAYEKLGKADLAKRDYQRAKELQ